jgi:hypothetical protein
MRSFISLVFALLALVACESAKSCDGWISYVNETISGEPVPFTTRDTVAAPVWSNDCIHMTGQPVFYDEVITGASQAECPMDSAVFLGPDPLFGAGMTEWEWPLSAGHLRQGAAAQGNFYDVPFQTVRAVFSGASVRFYRWTTGTPFDSTIVWSIPISQGVGTCIFVNGPLEIKGIVTGKVTIGSAGTVRILDDTRYDDADPRTGYTDMMSLNILGIVSESDVIIANTFENGRDNSGMPNGTWGREQIDRNLTDIVITASIEVYNGSFTFEDQNDSSSGHVSEFSPDDRGTVHLFGSVKQYRQGYLNRTNNIFTGYQLQLLLDQRLVRAQPPCFFYWDMPDIDVTDSLDFGDVAVGNSALDTAFVATSCPMLLESVHVSLPFNVVVLPPFVGQVFHLQVGFAPPDTLLYVDTLFAFNNPPMLILRGRGVPPSASDSAFIIHRSSFIVSAFPNPFNARTEIHFTLPQAGRVSLDLFDITGRKAMTVLNGNWTAGEHALPLDGSDLASGVYFARILTSHGQTSLKIALIR